MWSGTVRSHDLHFNCEYYLVISVSTNSFTFLPWPSPNLRIKNYKLRLCFEPTRAILEATENHSIAWLYRLCILRSEASLDKFTCTGLWQPIDVVPSLFFGQYSSAKDFIDWKVVVEIAHVCLYDVGASRDWKLGSLQAIPCTSISTGRAKADHAMPWGEYNRTATFLSGCISCRTEWMMKSAWLMAWGVCSWISFHSHCPRRGQKLWSSWSVYHNQVPKVITSIKTEVNNNNHCSWQSAQRLFILWCSAKFNELVHDLNKLQYA